MTSPAKIIQVPADPVKAAFVWYSWLVPKIQNLALKGDPKRLGRAVEDAKWVWPKLRDARLFALAQSTFVALYTWADQFTTTEIADMDFVPGQIDEDGNIMIDGTIETTPEGDHYNKSVTEAGRHHALPQNLPFDNTFFVYGSGIRLTEEQLILRVGSQDVVDQVEDPNLIGHLVSHSGEVVEFIIGTMEGTDREGALFFHEVHNNQNGWDNPLSLNPWVISGAVDLVNSFKTVLREEPHNFSSKNSWRAAQKQAARLFGIPIRPVPQPFYRLDLRHDLLEDWKKEQTRSVKKRASWKLGHRVDVRGHERVRVMRGPLPLDPKIEKALRKRGYRIFLENVPTTEDSTWRILAQRHEKPKSSDEWLAIKVSWIHDHIRGPAEGPYIPAIRALPTDAEAP